MCTLNRLIEKREKEVEKSYTLMISVAEVYNEQINDLLVLSGQQVCKHLGNYNVNYVITLLQRVLPMYMRDF